MEDTNQTLYTFQHGTTGVIVKVYHDNPNKAKKYVDEMMEELPLFFPEGDWDLIGVRPYEETW